MNTIIITATAIASFVAGTVTGSAMDKPMIKNVGTWDTAVRVDRDHYIQLEHLPVFVADRAGLIDCQWFEDGSARCD